MSRTKGGLRVLLVGAGVKPLPQQIAGRMKPTDWTETCPTRSELVELRLNLKTLIWLHMDKQSEATTLYYPLFFEISYSSFFIRYFYQAFAIFDEFAFLLSNSLLTQLINSFSIDNSQFSANFYLWSFALIIPSPFLPVNWLYKNNLHK